MHKSFFRGGEWLCAVFRMRLQLDSDLEERAARASKYFIFYLTYGIEEIYVSFKMCFRLSLDTMHVYR